MLPWSTCLHETFGATAETEKITDILNRLACARLQVTLFKLVSRLQETFGAMAKTEKIAYILEQVRLCLDRKDFVRAQAS